MENNEERCPHARGGEPCVSQEYLDGETLSPRTAATATLALNSFGNTRRFRLMDSPPHPSFYRPRIHLIQLSSFCRVAQHSARMEATRSIVVEPLRSWAVLELWPNFSRNFPVPRR